MNIKFQNNQKGLYGMWFTLFNNKNIAYCLFVENSNEEIWRWIKIDKKKDDKAYYWRIGWNRFAVGFGRYSK